jgi:hypothetical protein
MPAKTRKRKVSEEGKRPIIQPQYTHATWCLYTKLTSYSRRCNTWSYSGSEEDIACITKREPGTVFESQDFLEKWTIKDYVRSVTNVLMKLDLTLIDWSGNLDPVRASKNSKSTTSSVANAKRDIRRKADELVHIMEIQYATSWKKFPLILVSEVLTKSHLAELKTGIVILDLVLLLLNQKRHLIEKQWLTWGMNQSEEPSMLYIKNRAIIYKAYRRL